MLHILVHVLVPAAVAGLFFRKDWLKVWGLLVAAFVLDLDHLFAEPIYDPDRCSIGFHFLHSYPAIAVYGLLLFMPKTRILALGFLIHMGLDYLECL